MLKRFFLESKQINSVFRRSHSLVNKVKKSADEATSIIKDGSSIMVGGFGVCGIPENLIDSVYRKNIRDLTVISNNCGILAFYYEIKGLMILD